MVTAFVSNKFRSSSIRVRKYIRARFRELLFVTCNMATHTKSSFLLPRIVKQSRTYRFRPSFQLLEDRRLLAGTISGRIWFDADYDGIQDGSETQNFENVVVALHRSGEADRTSTTNANGLYSFNVPANGSYHMSFTFPAGYTLTRAIDDTHFDTFTANTTSTYTNYITVTDGTTQVFDAGLIQGGTMAVYCWNDADGDGIQDPGSPEQDGLSGANVTLTGSAFAAVSATSNANGLALFTNIRPATFHINSYRSLFDRTIQDAGLDDTRDSDVEVGTGNSADFDVTPAINITHIDVGFVDPAFGKGSISGKAWLDNGDGIRQAGENGLTGTFYFDLYQTTDNIVGNADDQYIRNDATDANFVYEFLNVPVGKYYVKAAPGLSYILAPKGQGGDTTINSDFVPATLNTDLITVAANVATTNIDAGLVAGSASVGDRIWNDVNANGIQDAGESGLAGARVRLYTSANLSVGPEIITDATGSYLFSNLTAGNYYVQVSPPGGYLASPKDQGANDLTDSDIDRATLRTAIFAVTTTQTLRWDAGFYLGATIGNRVWNDVNKNGIQDAGEGNLASVAVQLYNSASQIVKTAYTDANGIYTMTGIDTGQHFLYIYRPTGYLLSPRDVNGDTQDTVDNDFDPLTQTTIWFDVTRGQTYDKWDAGLFLGATVGDKVWLDANQNGRQDAGELGKAGVTVKLKTAGPDRNVGTADDVLVMQTATNANGIYQFRGVDNGVYYVEFSRPTGFVFTARDVGTDTGDSDAGRLNGRTQRFTIVNHANNFTIDAGLVPAGFIRGHVGEDKDRGGTVDPGPGRPGVVIIIIDPRNGIVGDDDDVEKKRLISDGNGDFDFGDLSPGQYVIRVELPPGWQFMLPGSESDINHFCDGYGYTSIIVVGPGSTIIIKIGLQPAPAAIEGIVWNDANRNKVRDGGLIHGNVPDIILAIDISGSTSEPFSGTTVGDVNGDGFANTVLDAEIQAGIALTQQLIGAGYGTLAWIGIVTFNGSAQNIDMNPVAANLQIAVPANSNVDADAELDVVEALQSLRSGGATNYEAALQQVISSFTSLGTAAGNGNLIFLSDGVPTTGGSFDDEIATLLAADVNMRAFGVGQAASLTELRKIDPTAKIYVTGEDLLAAVNLNNTTGYPGEEGMAGVSVYLDLNNNGVWNSATEPRAVTLDDDPDTSDFDETGYYRFDNLFAGTYHVREVIPTGHTQTYPGSTLFKHVVVLDSGDIRSGIDFGNAANPSIAGIPTTQNYASGSAGVLLATSALVSDADTPIFNGGTLRVRVSANSQTTDILGISSQGNGVGQIGVSGSTISYGGVAIGSFTGGSGSTALLITFNGNATLASVQAVARRITFRSTLATPSSATRTVEWRLTDGTGGTSALVNESVTIT